jgi:hypothetical protein
MLAQRLAPDDLRSQFQPYRPDTQADGSPDPNATEGWSQAYQDWQQRGREMGSFGDWMKGAAGEYANALLMGSTAPGGRILFHGTNAEIAGGMRPSTRGAFGPGVLEHLAAVINHDMGLGIDTHTRRIVALHVLATDDFSDVDVAARRIVDLLLGKRTLH